MVTDFVTTDSYENLAEKMLNLELIEQAAARIAGRVHRTPVMTSQSFNEVAGCDVFFKCENLQRAGAFKARGATNKILSLTDDEKRRGVIAVSSGNHAQAVALACLRVSALPQNQSSRQSSALPSSPNRQTTLSNRSPKASA